MSEIVYHMTYEEVVNLLGEPITHSESGIIKTEWKLTNGRTIWIWFSHSKETGNSLVVGYFVE